MSDERLALGVDLGGTNIRLGVAPLSGPIPTVAPLMSASAPRSLDELLGVIDAALTPSVRQAVAGLGMAVPGLVHGTTCTWVPNLAYLDGVDLADECDRRLGLGFIGAAIGNDAHMSLVAEAVSGAAAGADSALLLAIGTGIGSAVLSGGRVHLGAHGGACSFGWATADVPSLETDIATADQSGWLERHAAGRAIDFIGSSLKPARRGADVVAAARRGDAECIHALEPVARALGAAVAAAVSLLDPEMVIVSGGVADALDVLIRPLRDELERNVPPHLRQVPVVRGKFGAAAALTGAMVAARSGSGWRDLRKSR